MMAARCILILYIILLLPVAYLQAQILVVDSQYFLIDPIEDETVDEILNSVKQSIQKYDSFADVLDNNHKIVSQEAINLFKNLFVQNAKILNDITRNSDTQTISYADYASQIYNYLPKEGVNFDMHGALIDAISYDSSGFYQVDVLSEKYIYNGLEANKNPFYCKSGRRFLIKMIYLLPEENIQNAKLQQIGGSLLNDCEVRPVLIRAFWQSGVSLSTKIKTLVQDSLIPSLSYNTTGLNINIPINSNNGTYIYSGVHHLHYRLQIEKNEEKETLKMNHISIPLGIKFKLMDKNPFYIIGNVETATHFPIGSQFTNHHIMGKTSLSTHRKPFFTLQGALFSQWAFHPKIALEVGLSYHYSLTSTHIFNNTEEVRTQSIAAEHIKSFRPDLLGVNIGLIYKLSKQNH